jgi:putative tryptophan/tyrosine transport system substrate-binding protein
VRRRDFIATVAGAAAWPIASHAQQATKMPRIGVLLPGTPESFALRRKALVDGLAALGRVEGKTVAIEWKWGQDRADTLPALAADLIQRRVDVLVTGGTQAAQALKAATPTIPIVMAIIGDPVAAGLVNSLSRPGGNATGFSIVAPELGTKRLELLKEVVPVLSRVAVLFNGKNPQSQIELKELQKAAQAMALTVQPAEIAVEDGIDDAFAVIEIADAQALIVLTDPVLFSQRKRIVDLAARNRLPGVYFFQGFVEAGGLMSYGPSDTDLYRRAGVYVDRILKGTKPSELPVEQPTKFELYINRNAAKALGIAIPQTVLLRADKVVE